MAIRSERLQFVFINFIIVTINIFISSLLVENNASNPVNGFSTRIQICLGGKTGKLSFELV